MFEQHDAVCTHATTAPLDAVKRLISFGDGLLIKRNRGGDQLTGRLGVGGGLSVGCPTSRSPAIAPRKR
jgi:hypothetical protein